MTKRSKLACEVVDISAEAAGTYEGAYDTSDAPMSRDREGPVDLAAAAPAKLPIGARIFSRYVLVEPLSSSGGNTRYLAQDEVGHMKVVLTLARAGPEDADGGNDALWHAAKRLRRLTDELHLIRIMEIHRGQFDGIMLLGIVQAHVEGGSLLAHLTREKSRLPDQEIDLRVLFRQMALGVAALHTAGIAGLELRAEHFVLSDGVLKLDGLTCLPGGASLASAREKAADVNSLGRIMVCLLSAPLSPIAPARGTESIKVPAEARASVPPSRHLRRVIECCLSSDPASRFCDALELIRALDDESMAWDAEDRAARDEAWQDIESAMALGDFATAAGACNAFLQTWPNDQEARCLSEKLQTRYADAEQVYRQIEDGLGSGALGRMADLLQQAVNLYPDHPSGVRVQVQIASLAREFQECMKSGLRLLRCGAWEGALQCFQRAHALDHGSPAVLQALDFVTEVVQRVRSTRVEIDDAIRRRDKTMALAQARALDAYVDEVRAFLLELDG